MMTDKTARVPVWVEGDPAKYTVCLGKEHYRYYTDDTVPGQIKASLSMVRAFPEEVRRISEHRILTTGYGMASPPFSTTYACPDSRLEEIGWQVDDGLYVLILEYKLLEDMYTRG